VSRLGAGEREGRKWDRGGKESNLSFLRIWVGVERENRRLGWASGEYNLRGKRIFSGGEKKGNFCLFTLEILPVSYSVAFSEGGGEKEVLKNFLLKSEPPPINQVMGDAYKGQKTRRV